MKTDQIQSITFPKSYSPGTSLNEVSVQFLSIDSVLHIQVSTSSTVFIASHAVILSPCPSSLQNPSQRGNMASVAISLLRTGSMAFVQRKLLRKDSAIVGLGNIAASYWCHVSKIQIKSLSYRYYMHKVQIQMSANLASITDSSFKVPVKERVLSQFFLSAFLLSQSVNNKQTTVNH